MSEGTEISVYGCQCMNGCEQCREMCCQQCCQQYLIDKEREEETEVEKSCSQKGPRRSSQKGPRRSSQKVQDEAAKKVQDEAAKKVQDEAAKKVQDEAAKKVQDKAAKKVQDEAAKKVQDEAAKEVQDEAAKKVQDEAAKKVQDEAAKEVQDEAAKKFQDEAAKKVQDEAAKEVQDAAAKKVQDEAAKKVQDEAAKKVRDAAAKKVQDEAAKKVQDEAAKEVRDEAANRDGDVRKNRTAKTPSPPLNISFGAKILIGALITSVIINIAVITGFAVYASSNHCVGCNTTLTTIPNMTNFPNFTIEHPRIPNIENENTTEPPVIEIKMDAISYATNASTLKTAERETRTNLTANTTAPFELSIEKDTQSINSAIISDTVTKNFLGEKLDNLDSSPENLTPSLALSIDKAVLGISGSKTDSSLVSTQQLQDKETAPLQLTIEKDAQSINSATITDTDVSKNFLRPFSCPICKRRFKRIERLQRHTLIHQS
uniref:C2H2-type domain-containing protein n=1 Tax=Daphnia galeata TaxID=27404 RepID=A0A8J2RQF2_9CRUS|nr:unnamed protein product [Daphnia galeata]